MVNLCVEKYLSKHLQKVLIDYGVNYLITPYDYMFTPRQFTDYLHHRGFEILSYKELNPFKIDKSFFT